MIQVTNISIEKGNKQIIKEASFQIRPGKITVVIGKNGAGKSTLIEALTGGNAFQTGQIQWDGQAIAKISIKTLAQRRAVLAQKVNTSFAISVKELVEMGVYVSEEALSAIKIESLIRHALEAVEMYDFKDRDFTTLSGGEQKRVLLAKCMVQLNCCHWADVHKYLFLDEPTASLDIEQQYKFIELVKKLVVRRNIGVFAVLHDLNLAAQFADEIIILKNGKIAECGTPNNVFTPAILANTFDIKSIVNPHPVFGCPHITTLPKHLETSQFSFSTIRLYENEI